MNIFSIALVCATLLIGSDAQKGSMNVGIMKHGASKPKMMMSRRDTYETSGKGSSRNTYSSSRGKGAKGEYMSIKKTSYAAHMMSHNMLSDESSKTSGKKGAKSGLDEEHGAEPAAKPASKSAANSDTKKADKSDTKKDAKPDTKKAEKSDTKKDAKPDTKKADKSDTKKAAKPDTKKATKSDTKKAEKSDTKKDAKSDTKKADKSDTSTVAEPKSSEKTDETEDVLYWKKFVEDEMMMSMTPPPEPSPEQTPPPTPTPAPVATPAPVIPETLTPEITSVPTPLATEIPEPCDVTVTTTCLSSKDGIDCNDIIPLVTICQARPTSMVMKFNGGDCSQSFNIQNADLFQCSDFNGAPPTDEGAQSYIVFTDIKGQGIIYYEGFAAVGSDILLENGGAQVDANMNVTIYSSDDKQPSSILQTMIFHSSCSRNLFLKDRFGSIQLVEFTNEPQGTVTCFINATLTFSVVNQGSNDATFYSLVTESNIYGTLYFIDQVVGQEVATGATFETTTTILIDLTVQQDYTFETTLTGQAPGGAFCNATDVLEFTAGNPDPSRPPAVPETSAPILAPVSSTPVALPATPAPIATTIAPIAATVTAAPVTLAPVTITDAGCSVVINTTCSDKDGLDCNDIIPLVTICQARPTSMVMKFNGGDCSQSFNIQNADLFQCSDFNGAPPTDEGAQSYIVFTDIKGQGIIYYEGFAAVGSDILLENGGAQVDANMNVTIYSSDDKQPSSILQTMIFHSSCSRNLFLKDRFGSIQLVEFTNEPQGTVTCFINATLTFSVVNQGSNDATFYSLVTESNIYGTLYFIDQVVGQEVATGATFETTTTILIDLTVQQDYTFETTLTGQAPGGAFCNATDVLEFTAGNS